MNYYLDVWHKYAQFDGRSRRMEYWMFVVFNAIASILVGVIDSLVRSGGILVGIYSLAVILPSIAVFVRRMHDTGRSGWWWLIGLIPLVGAIILLVWLFTDGQPGDNRYGPNPKGISPLTPQSV